MLTSKASRTGLTLPDWSLKRLLQKSGVACTTVSQIENGRQPYGSAGAKIIAAFEAEGVELLADADRTGAVLVYARRR